MQDDLRKRARRAGRQKGVSIYVTAEELRTAGIDPDDLLDYRVYPGVGKRGVAVTFYAARPAPTKAKKKARR